MPIFVGGATLLVVVAGIALGIAFLSKRDPRVVSAPEAPIETPRPALAPPEPPLEEPARAEAPPPEPEPAVTAPPPVIDPPPEPETPTEAASATAPKEWPPARAFTERCKAPGGGCVEQCRPLAGGRCLDPCFIHTDECSKDCVQTDGSCGWPPPDVE